MNSAFLEGLALLDVETWHVVVRFRVPVVRAELDLASGQEFAAATLTFVVGVLNRHDRHSVYTHDNL